MLQPLPADDALLPLALLPPRLLLKLPHPHQPVGYE